MVKKYSIAFLDADALTMSYGYVVMYFLKKKKKKKMLSRYV